MKKILLLPIAFILFIVYAHAQNCSVNITGINCTGNQLTAGTTGGTLSSLTWYYNTSAVYGADTISSQGNISVVAGNHGAGGGANQFAFPAGGIFVDPAGNIYVADVVNSRIQKWAPGASAGITVAGGNGAGNAANQLDRPKDVFVDAAGYIYIADENNQRIQKWAPGATSGITVAGGNGAGSAAQQFNSPEGVCVDASGNIYVADKYNYRVQRWAPGANRGFTVAGGNGFGVAANQFNYPVDVCLDATNNIYVADINTESAAYHRVQKWKLGETSGVTVAGGSGQFGFLLAIYVEADGTLYTADNGIDGAPVSRIQKWLPGSGVGITVAGGHSTGWDILRYPTGVAMSNGALYVLDGITNPRVQKYIPVNGIVDNKFIPAQTGSYTIQAVFKNGCTAQSNPLIVSAVPGKPQVYATQKGGRGNLCEGGIDTFYVVAWDDAASYAWQIPATCTLVADNNDSVVISVPAGFSTGLLTAKGTNFCGTGIADTIQLQGKPVKPLKIAGPKTVFPNQISIGYSVQDNENSTYNWIVPQDATITAGQGSAGITVNWGSSAGIVSVSEANDCGKSARKELSVTLRGAIAVAQNVSGIKVIHNNAQLFPNPAKANTTIRFNAVKEAKAMIELQDIHGKVFMRKEIIVNAGTNNVSVDISRYASGMYFISVVSAQEKIRLKLNKA